MKPKKKPKLNKRLAPEVRLEVVKVLFYFEHKNLSEIATKLGVDKSTISKDFKKIKEDFKLNKLNLGELSSVICLRVEKRQKELFDICTKSKNPYVMISCLRHMREEDKALIELLHSIGRLRQHPHHKERLPLRLILETKKPDRREEKQIKH